MLHDNLLVFQEKNTATAQQTGNVLDVRGGTGGRLLTAQVLYDAGAVGSGNGTAVFTVQESDSATTGFTDLSSQTVNLTTANAKGELFIPATTKKRYLRVQMTPTGAGATITYSSFLVIGKAS